MAMLSFIAALRRAVNKREYSVG